MESLNDIAAEMRTRSREVKEAFGGRPDGVENMLDIWSDRIEAAWKRQEKTYLDQIRDAMNMWGHEKHIAEHAQKPTVGNAAAMREALVKAKKAICHYAEHICQSLSWENSDLQSNCADVLCAHRELCKAKTAINAALSEPPRQFDVGTAEEQEARMMRYCAGRKCERCQFFYGVNEGVNCDFTWAQVPYEAEEGAKRDGVQSAS